jgi:hypothetical protein
MVASSRLTGLEEQDADQPELRADAAELFEFAAAGCRSFEQPRWMT